MRWDVVPFWQNACATSAGEAADMSHFECHTLMAKIIPPTLHKWETSTGRSRLDSESPGQMFSSWKQLYCFKYRGTFKCNLHPDLTTSICCFSRPAAGLPLDLCTGWPQFPYAGLNSLSQIHTILCTKGIIQLYKLPHWVCNLYNAYAHMHHLSSWSVTIKALSLALIHFSTTKSLAGPTKHHRSFEELLRLFY